MEGRTKPTNKLRFIESKKKIKVDCQITQAHQKLITAANKHNLTLIGSEDNSVKFIETSQLLDFTSNQTQIINQKLDTLFSLTFRPTLLSVARYGYSSVLLVAGLSNFPRSPALEIYDLDSRTTIGKLSLNDLGDTEIIDYAWHPSYFDSIVALCTTRGQLLVLAINSQDKGIGIVYKNEQFGALTCCWSMKGKNLAVGTQRGHMFRLEPIVANNSFSFKEVNGSNLTFDNPSITPEHQLVRLRWINQKYLISVHAKVKNPNGPETVYSLITVKPGKPYLYWTNISFESQVTTDYIVHLSNLSSSVICASSATGEAAVIGVLGANEFAKNDLDDWSTLIIEEEGARIELPLDTNNRETHPCGVTMTTWPQDGRPILIFYTNDGLICPYVAMHSESILKFPEHINQPEQKFTFDVPKAAAPSIFSTGSPSFGGKASFYQAPQLFQAPKLVQPPQSGQEPKFFQTPQPVQEPKIVQAPQPVQEPKVNQAPQLFQAPKLVQPPQPVQEPKIVQAPQPVQEPKIVQAPQPVQEFKVTQAPQLVQAPKFVQEPQPILTPKFVQAPQPGQEPKVAQAPQLFQASKLVQAPQLGQEPKVVQAPQLFQAAANLSKKDEPRSTFSLDMAKKINEEIRRSREKLDYNEAYMSLLEELNYLRDGFDEILELHQNHREAINTIKKDIDNLDLELLETFYLIEYVKSRISGDIKKKTIDPVTLKKVNTMKARLKHIEGKLEELNDCVDVAWEDFVRRSNKERHTISLDMIYKALANNQKVINVLKKKLESELDQSAVNSIPMNKKSNIKINQDCNYKFEEFLSSRSIVPIRKPIHFK